MIPIYLKLKGLYSYQNEQQIDFSSLTQSRLFGIFGSVGSGKSAILEAICLALYGVAERFDSKRPSQYNLMNLKSDELYIEYIFKAKNALHYKFVLEAKRNKKHFDKISTFNRSAYKKENNDWTPLGKITADEIIGLSYEHFKKTIIIPQGKFQDFLQMPDKDRVEMLQDIFNLNKFDLSHKTILFERSLISQTDKIQGQLIRLKPISDEQNKIAKKELSQLKKDIKKNNIELKKSQVENDKLLKIQQNKAQLDKCSKEMSSLKKRLPEINQTEETLNMYESCFINFKSLLDQKNKNELETKKTNNDLNKNISLLRNAKQSLKEALLKFNSLEKDFKNKDTLLTKAKEIKIVIEVCALKKMLYKIQLNIDNQKLEIKKITSIDKQLKSSQINLMAEIKSFKEITKNYKKKLLCKEWYTTYDDLKKQQLKELQQLNNIKDTRKILREDKQTLITEPYIYKILHNLFDKPSLETVASIIERLNMVKAKNTEKSKCILKESQSLQLKQQLKKYSEELKDNTPCPLCGAKDHPHKLEMRVVDSELITTNESYDSIQKEISLINDLIPKLVGLQTNYDNNSKQIKQKEDEILKVQTAIKLHLDKFSWDYDPEKAEVIDKELILIESIVDKLQKTEKELDALNKELEENINKAVKENIDLNKIEKEHTKLDSQKTTLLKQIQLLNLEDFKTKSIDELEIEARSFEKSSLDIEQMFAASLKNIENIKKEKNVLEGQIKSLEKHLSELKNDLSKTMANINKMLVKLGYSNFQVVMETLKNKIDVGNEKKKINDFKQKYNHLNQQIKDISKDRKVIEYEETTHTELKDKIKTLQSQTQEKKVLEGRLSENIERVEKELKDKARLEKEHNQLNIKLDKTKLIKNLFMGKGFVKFASRVYLENLCRTANIRFRQITHNALSLELTDTNDFQIRDYLNNGELRSIKTLSGGQLFQVSFCLALALSDNIQQLNHSKENFFFMDEGFGSLDKDSLQLVFNTLKALKNENRIIGVISHVESLQQEFDVYLKVENDSHTGSKIINGWRI
jgi:DNA repair protein SbcC/Rad50